MHGSKHIGDLEEQGIPLGSFLAKPGCSLLVGQLHQAKRRLEAIDKKHLDVVLIQFNLMPADLIPIRARQVRFSIDGCHNEGKQRGRQSYSEKWKRATRRG